MSTSTELYDPDDAVTARSRLVDDLLDSPLGVLPRVADTMRRVPRHRFVPDASIADACAHDTVAIKRDTDGAMLNCASAPSIVATMLTRADVQPGDRIWS